MLLAYWPCALTPSRSFTHGTSQPTASHTFCYSLPNWRANTCMLLSLARSFVRSFVRLFVVGWFMRHADKYIYSFNSRNWYQCSLNILSDHNTIQVDRVLQLQLSYLSEHSYTHFSYHTHWIVSISFCAIKLVNNQQFVCIFL